MKVVLLLACWSISFLFAGIEAGLLALNPVRLRHRAKSSDRAAQRLQTMLQNPERLLITVLLATNAADISPTMTGEDQGKLVPPKLVNRTRAERPSVSKTAPA